MQIILSILKSYLWLNSVGTATIFNNIREYCLEAIQYIFGAEILPLSR